MPRVDEPTSASRSYIDVVLVQGTKMGTIPPSREFPAFLVAFPVTRSPKALVDKVCPRV